MIVGEKKTRDVFIDDEQLSPARSQSVWNHSPDGFNWGYHGSGPAQLALAIMLELTDDEDMSIRLHQRLKQDFLADLPDEDFELDEQVVLDWIAKHNKKDTKGNDYGRGDANMTLIKKRLRSPEEEAEC